MTKVTPIHGGSVPGTPNERVVKALEGLMERAQKGEIVSLAFAGVDREGTVVTGWEHESQLFALIGGVSYLSHRLLSE